MAISLEFVAVHVPRTSYAGDCHNSSLASHGFSPPRWCLVNWRQDLDKRGQASSVHLNLGRMSGWSTACAGHSLRPAPDDCGKSIFERRLPLGWQAAFGRVLHRQDGYGSSVTVNSRGAKDDRRGELKVDDSNLLELEFGRLLGQDLQSSKTKASLSLDSEHGNVWARDALEANLAETSGASTSTLVLDRKTLTGGAFDFSGATAPLTTRPIPQAKKIVLVRHGLSCWNAEGRIQGSSDLSLLSDEGVEQAERCKQALAKLKFNSCFASPISRAKTSAEVIWTGREEPLIFLDSLKEAHLLVLEGMRNVDAREQHPELFRTWREDPVNFHVNGVYPVVKLWAQARDAWQEILSSEGELILVVTHKSILRALLCTALGMGPDRFRAVDINNGGISVFSVNTKGEPLLQCLNMTAHLCSEGIFY